MLLISETAMLAASRASCPTAEDRGRERPRVTYCCGALVVVVGVVVVEVGVEVVDGLVDVKTVAA